MAEVIVRLLEPDPGAAVDQLRSIEGAMDSVTQSADRMGAAMGEIATGGALRLRSSLWMLTSVLTGMGVQTGALRTSMMAASLATKAITASTQGLATAAKGMLVSMGPVGLALLAIGAALAGIIALWNRHKKAVEENKKALEEEAKQREENRIAIEKHDDALRGFASISEQATIRWLRMQGEAVEANKRQLQLDYENRLKKLADDLAAEEKNIDQIETTWEERRRLSAKARRAYDSAVENERLVHVEELAKIDEDAAQARIDADRMEKEAREDIEVRDYQRRLDLADRINQEMANLEKRAAMDAALEAGKIAEASADADKAMFDRQLTYLNTLGEAEHDLAVAQAKDAGDLAKVRELAISQLVRTQGITYDQARALQAVIDQTQELTKAKKEERAAEWVGLTDIWKRIQAGAAAPGRAVPAPAAAAAAAPQVKATEKTTDAVEDLGKKLDNQLRLWEEIKRGLPLTGVFS